MQELYRPTPRENAERKVDAAHAEHDTPKRIELIGEAQVWALLDIADAIRELPERAR